MAVLSNVLLSLDNWQGRYDLVLLQTGIHSHSCPFRLRLCAIDVVEYLISIISPEAVNIQNDQGNTALHWAATNGHAKVVETLVTKGKADYKVQNRLSSLKRPISRIQRNSTTSFFNAWLLSLTKTEKQNSSRTLLVTLP